MCFININIIIIIIIRYSVRGGTYCMEGAYLRGGANMIEDLRYSHSWYSK